MYYTKQVGFGPFKKWVLMEKVSPRHKETRVPLKDGFIYTENGARPISSAKISITPDGYIVFNGTTKSSVKARTFEAFSRGFVFTTDDKTEGYVASNGNVVNPVAKGEIITGVDVYDSLSTIVYKKQNTTTGETFYTLGSTLGGGEYQQWGKYTSFEVGKKSNGLPRSMFILGNQDGTKAVINVIPSDQDKTRQLFNDNFVVLADSAIKVEKSDQILYILSTTRRHTGHESVLEGFDITSITSPHPRLKFMEYDVRDFDISFRELITHNDKTSTVYDVLPHSEGEAVRPRFTVDGTIKNVAPMFGDNDVYIQTNDGKNTLLREDGTACTNPELEGIKSIHDRYGFAYIIDVETKDGVKQGLFRTGDLSTLFPPCDKIRFFGDRLSKEPTETESLFVATHGDTFAVGKLEQYKSDAYLPPEILVGFNRYFKPQLTSEDCKLYVQDSYGIDGVLDCSAKNKPAVFTEMVAYASNELGCPLTAETKPTEFIESEDILIK